MSRLQDMRHADERMYAVSMSTGALHGTYIVVQYSCKVLCTPHSLLYPLLFWKNILFLCIAKNSGNRRPDQDTAMRTLPNMRQRENESLNDYLSRCLHPLRNRSTIRIWLMATSRLTGSVQILWVYNQNLVGPRFEHRMENTYERDGEGLLQRSCCERKFFFSWASVGSSFVDLLSEMLEPDLGVNEVMANLSSKSGLITNQSWLGCALIILLLFRVHTKPPPKAENCTQW